MTTLSRLPLFKDEDKKRKDLVDAKNTLDSIIYSLEKTVSDNQDKLRSSLADKIKEAVTKAKLNAETKNLEALHSESESLTRLSHELAGELYNQTNKSDKPNGKENTPKDNPEIVDAEFKKM